MKRLFIAVAVVGVGTWAVFNFVRDNEDLAKKQEVLAAATQRFKTELKACLSYNQQLFDHDREKIERGNPATKGNPKESRLRELQEWFQFEQDTCQQTYQGRLDYWKQRHN
jgi:hypothetical protein